MTAFRDVLARFSLRRFGIRFAAAGVLAILFLALMVGAGHLFAMFSIVAILPGMLLALLMLLVADFTQVPRWLLSDEIFEGPAFYMLLSLILSILFW